VVSVSSGGASDWNPALPVRRFFGRGRPPAPAAKALPDEILVAEMTQSSIFRREKGSRRAAIGDRANRTEVPLRGLKLAPSSVLSAPDEELDSETEHAVSSVSADRLESVWRLHAPVAVVMDFIGIGLSQYDELMSGLEISREGSALPGCLFHWAASTPDGVRATEVWRNIKLFDFFLREEVLPTVSALRVPDPELTVYAVHHFLTEGRLESLET
jgi:hypothetical protein